MSRYRFFLIKFSPFFSSSCGFSSLQPPPHHPTIPHKTAYKIKHTSCTVHYTVSLLFVIQKNTHNRFFFLPILATAIPSCKMFKLCSLFSFLCPFSVSKAFKAYLQSLHQERLKSSISCQKRQSVFKPIAPSDVVTLSYSVYCICQNASSKCAKALSTIQQNFHLSNK